MKGQKKKHPMFLEGVLTWLAALVSTESVTHMGGGFGQIRHGISEILAEQSTGYLGVFKRKLVKWGKSLTVSENRIAVYKILKMLQFNGILPLN